MSKAKMDWIDAEELAAVMLGIGEDYDSEKIEDALFEKFEISFEQFHKVAEALMPFTVAAETAIGGKIYCGFVHDGAFIAKMDIGA